MLGCPRLFEQISFNFRNGGSYTIPLMLLSLLLFELGLRSSNAFVPTISILPFLNPSQSSLLWTVSSLHLASVDGSEATINGGAQDETNLGKTVVVAGATGYIGKAVVRESLRQGYKTIAFVRDSEKAQSDPKFSALTDKGAVAIQCDVTNYTQVLDTMKYIDKKYCGDSSNGIAAIVSCLASRSGVKKDAYLIDYEATNHCLQAGIETRAKHFILLSAFCVQKPLLQFQQGKQTL
jgi:NAD(P)H-binding